MDRNHPRTRPFAVPPGLPPSPESLNVPPGMPALDRAKGELTPAEARAVLDAYPARRAEQVEREDEILATLKSTIVNRLAEERASERKRVREALLAEVERVSFALEVFGVTLAGGKVACRTADIRDGIDRILPEEG